MMVAYTSNLHLKKCFVAIKFGVFCLFKTIADVIRTCLGPQAMLKMLMDPMGGIVMTNDGNAILREITVQHPAAKTMIEIARTQDEEVRTSHVFSCSSVRGWDGI